VRHILWQERLVVGILIFDQVEILDVAAPFEVFSVTRLNEEHRWVESSPFRVLLVSERMDQVLAYGGLRLTPDVTIDNCPELDLLIVPGGWGTRTEVRNNNLLNWIAVRAAKTRLTASVCTGSSLLGKAGLLDGHEATTHWRAFDFQGSRSDSSIASTLAPCEQQNQTLSEIPCLFPSISTKNIDTNKLKMPS
jgi:putative intracellular protease/amidase